MKEALVFLVGIAVGAINSVGGGGMLLGFPVLVAIGLPAIIANATGKLVVLPGQVGSIFGYRKFLSSTPRRYYVLIIPGAIGGAAGALLLKRTSNAQFETVVPYLVLAAVILFALQPTLQKRLQRHKRRKVLLPLPIIAVCMLAVSIYAGYFGIGFGFMMLALLSFSGLRSIHHMNLVKSIVGSFTAVCTVSTLISSSLIDWKFGVIMAIGNGIGGYGMARMAPRLPSALIRGVVICLGVLTAFYFLLHRQTL
jgi:hypothetical protein